MHRAIKLLKRYNNYLLLCGLIGAFACMTPIADENEDKGEIFPTSPAPRLHACITDPQCTYPLVVSHRGEGSNYPENAIFRINSVVAMGADIVAMVFAK